MVKSLKNGWFEDKMFSKIRSYFSNLRQQQEFALELLQMQNAIGETQSIFKEYKDCLRGKEVAIVATGPTLNEYIPGDNITYIGVNKAYKKKEMIFSYYFVQDYIAVKNYVGELKDLECDKFVGRYILHEDITSVQIPEDIRINISGIPFFNNWPLGKICSDISNSPFAGRGTITLSAMQFALYAGARQIDLVGCDTSQNGYFDKSKQRNPSVTMDVKKIVKDYCDMRDYAKVMFPGTRIVSINPVGLRGIFEDIYTIKHKTDTE